MITVIIAGGSGTRLWPLSTPEYPKHLLALTGHRSLVHYTYQRAKTLGHKVYVVTEASHAHHVKAQLPELKDDAFIIEPGRRGTAHCILAVLSHLAKTDDRKETIAFIPADHYVRDTAGFTYSFERAGAVSARAERIVLIGVDPDYPATGFGYIQKGESYDEEAFVFTVKAFKEKPEYQIAQTYVDSGEYLWNCGYFVGSCETFIKSMQQYAPDLYDKYQALSRAKDQAQFSKIYLGFNSISIDYALIEKTPNLLVLPAAFDWMDVGSFPEVHKVNMKDEVGNTLQGKVTVDGVSNSLIRNDTEIPVAVIGLDNVAVISTPNGMLVINKGHAQKVGDVSKRVNGDS